MQSHNRDHHYSADVSMGFMQVTVKEFGGKWAFIYGDQNLDFLMDIHDGKDFLLFSIGRYSTMVTVELTKHCTAHNSSL